MTILTAFLCRSRPGWNEVQDSLQVRGGEVDHILRLRPNHQGDKSNKKWSILSFFHRRSSEPTLVVSRSRSATDTAPPIWASIACRHQAIASWRESEFSIAILWSSLSSSFIDMARTLVGNPDHHWKWQKFLSSPSAVWVCPARSITAQWRLAGCRHWRHWWAADFPRSQLAARLLLLARPSYFHLEIHRFLDSYWLLFPPPAFFFPTFSISTTQSFLGSLSQSQWWHRWRWWRWWRRRWWW